MTIDVSIKTQIFLDNFLSISDSMYSAKNNIAGVENNYLQDNILCKMSNDEIFGIGALTGKLYSFHKTIPVFLFPIFLSIDL